MPISQTEPKWKRFERLVAGLHHALAPSGAFVTWDDHIDGRQFDITIRFEHVAYRFLTIVECKDCLVPVGDVEAFVTKSRSAYANKAVIVSSVGFQSGAVKVAAENGIDLYVFEESDEWPSWLHLISEAPALSISGVEILNDSEVVHRFRDESSALIYFTKHVVVRTPSNSRSLDETIMSARDVWEIGTNDTAQSRIVPLAAGAIVDVPFVDPMQATMIRFVAQVGSAKMFDTGGMDVSLVPQLFRFKNAITGEERTIDAAELWIGFDTELETERFYYNPFLSNVYFCEAIQSELAHYILIESYQHGTLFQARFTQNILYRRHLLEVNDQKEISRLRRMLAQFRSGGRTVSSVPRTGRNDACPCGSGVKYKKCHGK